MNMFKRICKKNTVAAQFNYVDGIDDAETHKVAKSLGLSQNTPFSVLWEAKTFYGWKIVNRGDWIIKEIRAGFNYEDRISVLRHDEFEREFKVID